MAGFKTHSRYPTPPSRPPLTKPFLIAVAAAIALPLLLKTCAHEEPPPPPEPEITKPEAEPKRVPHFFAVASSWGSSGYADAPTRADAETKALDLCEAHRRSREKKFTYVGVEGCRIRGVASNFDGAPCIALSTNDTEYDIEPHVELGSDISLPDQLRAYLMSDQGKYYNTAINPAAKTLMLCVGFYGEPTIEDVGYEYSRPALRP